MDSTLDLLFDCCRLALGRRPDDLAARLRQADGAALAALARRHGVEALVWRLLRENGLALPGTAALGLAARNHAAHAERLGSESARINRSLAAASLPHLFLGGPALAAMAWGDPRLISRACIDLLVTAPATGRAGALLALLGYVQEEPDPSVDTADWHRRARTSCWRSDDGVILRLHARAADPPGVLAGLTATTTPALVEVGGGLALPTFTPALQLPLQAVSQAADAWDRLADLADFAAIVRRLSPSELASTTDRAGRLGAERPLAASLVLSHRLLGTPLPDELWFDGGARRLVALGEAELREPLAARGRRLGWRRAARARLLLQPGSRFFMSEGLRQLGAALIP